MRCTPSSLLSLAAAGLLTLGLSACGGGGGGSSAPTQPAGPQPQTPTGPGPAYLEMISDLIEFSAGIVDPNDPDTITLMHAPGDAYGGRVATRGSMYFLELDPSGADGRGVFAVDTSAPGTTVRLSPDTHRPDNAIVSADGNWLAYEWDSDLYIVNLANPRQAQRANGTLESGSIENFAFGPLSDRIFYIAAQDTAGVDELYTVPLSQPGNTTKLNAPLGTNDDVEAFAVSPDGATVVYRADHDADGGDDIYMVSVSSPGAATRLSGAYDIGLGVDDPAFSDSGEHVYYLAVASDAATIPVELRMATLANPGTDQRLTAPFADANRDVTEVIRQIPGTPLLLYLSDEATDDVTELFFTNLDNPGTTVKVSGALVPGGAVHSAVPNLQGTHVAYVAEGERAAQNDLYLVDLATLTPAKLTQDMAPGSQGIVFGYSFSPDGQYVFYTLVEASVFDGVPFAAPIATPGTGQIRVANFTPVGSGSLASYQVFPIELGLVEQTFE